MVKPLTFKGDKKSKKRKRPADESLVAKAQSSTSTTAATEDADANDDSWVSADAITDVAGPIMLVLPVQPAASIACDANGKVFAVPIENMVDGNPLSAEPHDVRQVWVANGVAGTESLRFKGHHGKYLSCDKFGILTATSAAVSPLESFKLVPSPDGPSSTFALQTSHGTFLSAKEAAPSRAKGGPELRADGTEMGSETTLRIRMQAQFKPRVKASREEKAREKISRRELEKAVGRTLADDEVKMLKRARREGDYHEKLLNVKVKNKHDKFG